MATLGEYVRRRYHHNAAALEIEEGVTVGDLLDRFSIPRGEVMLVLVNGRRAETLRPLADGDEIALLPPLGGG
ncbi:hypothetical protein SY88_11875 [Clostridiales bacterium PH28_bin88]|nr:hypothetical protein SY88_11875 [Clostridiales bacterium PH28_bin88]